MNCNHAGGEGGYCRCSVSIGGSQEGWVLTQISPGGKEGAWARLGQVEGKAGAEV